MYTCFKEPLEPWLESGKMPFRTRVGSHHKLWHFIWTYLSSTGSFNIIVEFYPGASEFYMGTWYINYIILIGKRDLTGYN